MDIDEYVKQVQPRKKRSRLIPFASQITSLKTQGYTDLQVRDWLAANGVQVSREMVRKFVAQKATEKGLNSKQDTLPLRPIEESEQETEAASNAERPPNTQAEKMRKMLEKQKDEASKKLFRHDKTGKN